MFHVKHWGAAQLLEAYTCSPLAQLLLGGRQRKKYGVEFWGQGLVEKYARQTKKIRYKKICYKILT
jgi:hypothetical protein